MRCVNSRKFKSKCCGPRKNQEAAEDAEDEAQAILAPIDDNATYVVLKGRNNIYYDFAEEWDRPMDSAWLDRVVCGKLSRKAAGKEEKFFGLLIASNPAPLCHVCMDKAPRATDREGQFLWPKFSQRHTQLKIDYLHLIPLQGRAAVEEPAESLDLGNLLRPPTLEPEGPDGMILGLDFGNGELEYYIEGEKQAERWALGVRAVLQSCLSAAAELEGPVLVEALQKYDAHRDTNQKKALKQQHQVMTEIAAQAAQEAEEEEDYDGTAGPKMKKNQTLDAMVQQMAENNNHPTTAQLLEALERIAALPRILVTAAERAHPVRMDILHFWEEVYHQPWCRCIEAIWNARISKMSPRDIVRIANLIHQYREWIETLRMVDTSLGPAVGECADVYGRRFFPSLTSLAENVAELCEVEWKKMPDGTVRVGTAAATDLFYFLGPPCEAALSGPPEMRIQAAEVVDGAFLRYQRFLKWRLLDAIEEERSGEKPLCHRQFVAALVGDAEELADNCHNILCEVGELGDTVAHVFQKIEVRFRSAAEAFCETLVTLCLRSTGAVRIFGLPPNPQQLVNVDLKRFLEEVLTPGVRQFQEMLSEPWRSRFALRLLSRFTSVEMFVLTHVPTKMDIKQTWKLPDIVAALKEHEKALRASVQSWIHESSKMFVDTRMQAFTDTIGILGAKPQQLQEFVRTVAQRHSGSLNSSLVKALMCLRTDLKEPQKADAILAAAQHSASPTGKRQSYLPVAEARFVGQNSSAFSWAMDLNWVAEVFGLNKKKDVQQELEKRPRPKRVKRKTDEEKMAERGAKVVSGEMGKGGKLQFFMYNKRMDVPVSRGFTVVVLNDDLMTMKECKTFDTSASKHWSDQLEQFLRPLEEHTVILAGVMDEGAKHLTDGAREALGEFGARKIENLTPGDNYAMIGHKAGEDDNDHEAEEACACGSVAKVVQVLKAEKRAKVVSAGFEDGCMAEFSLEGNVLEFETEVARGFNIVVLTDDDEVEIHRAFDTATYEEEADEMEDFLVQLPDEKRILVAVMDDGAAHLSEGAALALMEFGAKAIPELNIGDCYALIGKKTHDIEFQAIEVLAPGGTGQAVIDQMEAKKKVKKKKQKPIMALDDFLSGVSFAAPQAAAASSAAAEDDSEEEEDSDESDEESDEEDDDECLRGFLYKCDETAHRAAGYNAATGLLTLRWVTAAKKTGEAISHLSAGGWTEMYLELKKDMRGKRSLHWYTQMGDTISQGSLPIAEIDEVESFEEVADEKLPAILTIICKDSAGVERVVDFRSPWIHECNFWAEKLMMLRDRENASAFEDPIEDTGILLDLHPTLKIRDPERMGRKSTIVEGRRTRRTAKSVFRGKSRLSLQPSRRESVVDL